ncbi:MAG: hypothetical protein IKB02_09605 [Clostridia bacterium]|nr:hypothetical protein [Clostridia bacterium]
MKNVIKFTLAQIEELKRIIEESGTNDALDFIDQHLEAQGYNNTVNRKVGNNLFYVRFTTVKAPNYISLAFRSGVSVREVLEEIQKICIFDLSAGNITLNGECFTEQMRAMKIEELWKHFYECDVSPLEPITPYLSFVWDKK